MAPMRRRSPRHCEIDRFNVGFVEQFLIHMLANDADPNSIQSLLVRNNHCHRDKDGGLEPVPAYLRPFAFSAISTNVGPGIFGERRRRAEAGAPGPPPL